MSAREMFEYRKSNAFAQSVALKIKTSFTNGDHCPIYVLVHRAERSHIGLARTITKIRGEKQEIILCAVSLILSGIVHRHVLNSCNILKRRVQQAIIQNICHLCFTHQAIRWYITQKKMRSCLEATEQTSTFIFQFFSSSIKIRLQTTKILENPINRHTQSEK